MNEFHGCYLALNFLVGLLVDWHGLENFDLKEDSSTKMSIEAQSIILSESSL